MKLKFSYIAYAVILIALVIGVSRAYALTGPTGSAPSQPTMYVPVNNSPEPQTKKGSFLSGAGFGAGFRQVSNFTTPPTYSDWALLANNGGIKSENAIVSPWGFFTFGILTGTGSSVSVGSSDADSSLLPTIDQPASTGTSLKLDMVGRGTGNNSASGTTGMSILAGNNNSCTSYVTVRVNAPALKFSKTDSSDAAVDHADVIARGIQLKGGSPAKDSVLVSIDAQGRATWAKATVVGGQVQLTPNAPSPVATWDGSYN